MRKPNESYRVELPARIRRVGLVLALPVVAILFGLIEPLQAQEAASRLNRLLSPAGESDDDQPDRSAAPRREFVVPRRDDAVRRASATEEPINLPGPAADETLPAQEEIDAPEPIESEMESNDSSTWFDSPPAESLLQEQHPGLTHEEYELAPVPTKRWYIDPFGIQRRAGELAFGGDDPAEPELPRDARVGGRIPRIEFQFSPPDSRHVGRGEPLMGTSWRNRPLHVDLLTGGLFMTELIRGTVEPQNGLLVGTRLGWDVNHYLGGEFRLAQADVGLVGRTDRADVRLYDVMFNYYPWGDSRIRPFTSLGLGVAQFSFADELGLPIDETTLTMPFGFGVKAMVRPNIALRFEVIDNLALGSDVLQTMNNVSVTGGFEWKFGGHRRNYYPFLAAPRVW